MIGAANRSYTNYPGDVLIQMEALRTHSSNGRRQGGRGDNHDVCSIIGRWKHCGGGRNPACLEERMLISIAAYAVLLILLVVAVAAAYLFILWNRSGEYFDSNGARLHYVSKGKGTPVILVHGFAINLGGNWFFPHVFQRLAKDYRVIAIDNRGHGRSERFYEAEKYGTEFAEDIVRLMNHLKIEKAHVIGYSMGGFIVLKLATMYPERLLSVAPCGAGWTPNTAQELGLMQDTAESLERGTGFIPLLEWLEPPGRPKRWWMIKVLNAFMSALFDVNAMAAVLRSFPQLEVSEEALRRNTVPALAVIGGVDPIRVFAEQMAAVMANLELVVVPGADHGTALPSRVAMRAFRKFLAEHTR